MQRVKLAAHPSHMLLTVTVALPITEVNVVVTSWLLSRPNGNMGGSLQIGLERGLFSPASYCIDSGR